MKVVVIGATGYIGGHVVKELSNRGTFSNSSWFALYASL